MCMQIAQRFDLEIIFRLSLANKGQSVFSLHSNTPFPNTSSLIIRVLHLNIQISKCHTLCPRPALDLEPGSMRQPHRPRPLQQHDQSYRGPRHAYRAETPQPC